MSIQELPPKACFDLREADPAIKLVDVRTPEEFARGHPAGSVNVPAFLAGPGGMRPNPDFAARMAEVAPQKDQRLILSCQSGRRSYMAAELLAQLGWQQPINLRGGFGGNDEDPGWASAGLPIER